MRIMKAMLNYFLHNEFAKYALIKYLFNNSIDIKAAAVQSRVGIN